MEAGQARIEPSEPRSAEAASEPDLAVRGTKAIREVMVATEVEVASMLARVDADVVRLLDEADTHARMRVSDRREQLAGVRRELAIWAAAVAAGFENLLGQLDEADSRMAVPAPPRAVPDPPQEAERPQEAPAPPRPVPETAPFSSPTAAAAGSRPVVAAPEPLGPPRLRLAGSPAGEAEGEPAEVGGEAETEGAEGNSRPRWWRRWFRPAA